MKGLIKFIVQLWEMPYCNASFKMLLLMLAWVSFLTQPLGLHRHYCKIYAQI